MSQISQSKIKIYEFPDDVGCSSTTNGTSNPEDEKERRENRKLKERVPFAVVGSNTLIDPPDGGDKKIRGRRYPWGVVDVSNFIKKMQNTVHSVTKKFILRHNKKLYSFIYSLFFKPSRSKIWIIVILCLFATC